MGSKPGRVAKTGTEALVILWEEGFFRDWRKVGDIEGHLAKRGNNFTSSELGMALKRSKRLTKRGKRRTNEYIQKYPFAAEEVGAEPVKRKRK